MKKIFASTAALLLVFSITACSGSVSNDNKQTESVITTHTSVSTEAPKKQETNSSDTTKEKSTDKTPVEINTEIPETTEKTKTTIPTTKESVTAQETTTKKNVTTTRVQTTSPSVKKLPLYFPEAEIIALFNKVNNYRTQNNLNKLALDSDLCKMAYIRAQEQDILRSHTRPDNTEYYTILDEYNYDYYGCGENLSFIHNVSVESTFDRWKNSSAHNENLLESRFTKAGIAMHQNSDRSYSIVLLFAC